MSFGSQQTPITGSPSVQIDVSDSDAHTCLFLAILTQGHTALETFVPERAVVIVEQ